MVMKIGSISTRKLTVNPCQVQSMPMPHSTSLSCHCTSPLLPHPPLGGTPIQQAGPSSKPLHQLSHHWLEQLTWGARILNFKCNLRFWVWYRTAINCWMETLQNYRKQENLIYYPSYHPGKLWYLPVIPSKKKGWNTIKKYLKGKEQHTKSHYYCTSRSCVPSFNAVVK